MRTRYKISQENGIYFVTSTVVEWIPIFTSQAYFNIIIESLKYCVAEKALKLYAFVVLDNHFHLIVSGESLSRTLQSLKRFTSRRIIEQLKLDNKSWLLNQLAYFKKRYKVDSTFQVWQEGFHPQLILNEQMLVQKIEYIHNNAVKRGFVDVPEHWRYSSARNFILGDHSIIQLDALPV